MGDLKDLTVEGFVDVTASDAPAPGGGSVSALAGALAAALAEMVANLTVGKAKYAEVEDEMKELAAAGAALRKELVEDIQKDSTAFDLYMAGIKMPKETEEEKAARREAMQNGLKAAAQVPLSVAEAALKIFPIAEAVVARGNTNADRRPGSLYDGPRRRNRSRTQREDQPGFHQGRGFHGRTGSQSEITGRAGHRL